MSMKENFDLRHEPILNKEFVFQPQDNNKYSEGLLLTGSNSFIGIHLLHRLIKEWSGSIYCLIRAESVEHGISRLQESCKLWGLNPVDTSTIIVIPGDFSKSNWGLDNESYTRLKHNTGTVVHMALKARYNLPYSYYQENWLHDLENMINYCGDEDYPKRLHYPCSYNSHFYNCDDDFKRQDSCAWYSGYSGFKWIAEIILRKAYGGNLQGCIYDIPLVLGGEQNNKCPVQYSLWHVIDMFINSGRVNEFCFKVIGVDKLAEIICTNIMNETEGRGAKLIRPVCEEKVTHEHLIDVLRQDYDITVGSGEEIINLLENKRLASFMFPKDFTEIIVKAHSVPQILPIGFDKNKLPDGVEVFKNNLNEYLKFKYADVVEG